MQRPIDFTQFTSIRYGERLAEFGAVPSIGSVGDSFDNALAETVIGLYKTELIRGPDQGPGRTIDDVELATLGWVHSGERGLNGIDRGTAIFIGYGGLIGVLRSWIGSIGIKCSVEYI